MYFVILGALLVAMKLAELGPVGEWGWMAVLWPFLVAFLWWQYADKVGLTQKRAMDKMEERKAERRRKHLVALGINPRDRERSERARSSRKAEVAKVEAKREDVRKHHKEVVARSSQFDTSQVDSNGKT
jgi:small Trp-rich protein